MISRLTLKNLTVFSRADLEFASGLNVIVGENGTGKSHVLKAAYTIAAVMARGERDSGSPTPTKSYLATAIAKKMRSVFRPDELGRLACRQSGRNRCEIEAWFKPKSLRMGFSFNEGVTVLQGDTVDDVGKIDALQEELSQSDRYMEAVDR
jgi:AAA domain